jgi:tRNA modification GTPase
VTTTTTAAEQTYLARLTPPGSGAIAALALYGPDAPRILADLFQPLGKAGRKNPFRDSPSPLVPGHFWLGKLVDPAQGIGDEVVVALKSIAPQPWFEIHCHGGRQAIALVEELFAARGVRVCAWPELLRATGCDAFTVAALAALAEATTTRTAAILLDQYHGAFAAAVRNIAESVERADTDQAAAQLRELARWILLGRHLTSPWRVAVAGAPNVGKSSLINRLAGYSRCVVAPTPGTTRDLVSTRVAIDGWPVELIDTAGVREQAEALEAQGIELALAAVAEADLCLWLLDATAPPVLPPRPLPSLRLVINKTDLSAAWEFATVPEALTISAATGAGLEELLQALSRWLVPEVPPAGAAVPFSTELCDWLARIILHGQHGEWSEVARILQGFEETTNRFA